MSMRALRTIVLFGVLSAGVIGAETPPLPQPLPEVKLTTGAVFKNVTVVRYEKDKVALKWASGNASYAYSMIQEPLRGQMIAARDASAAAPSPSAVPEAGPAPRVIKGEAFIGGGESQGLRVKFAGLKIAAYELSKARAAFDTNTAPELPPSIAETESDGEGRFEIEVPAGVPVMIVAKGKHRAARGGRVTDWEWRVPDKDIKGNKVMLTDSNSYQLFTVPLGRK